MRLIKPRTDILSHPNVNYDRTMGLPTCREAYGNGDPIVVGGVTPTHGKRENRLQGEGGQELWLYEYRRYAKCRKPRIF
jgi:hypothetical protein